MVVQSFDAAAHLITTEVCANLDARQYPTQARFVHFPPFLRLPFNCLEALSFRIYEQKLTQAMYFSLCLFCYLWICLLPFSECLSRFKLNCSHHCVVTDNQRVSCQCPTGYDLKLDNRTCYRLRKYLTLFTHWYHRFPKFLFARWLGMGLITYA